MGKVSLGHDWAEDHHDVLVMDDDTGRRLAGGRLPEGVAGIARVHEMLAGVLADLGRTHAVNHRQIAGDSELVEAIKVLSWAHQSMIWIRQRQSNQLRSTLREFHPAALGARGLRPPPDHCV